MIAILSEYSRSETTLAALRLADLAIGYGEDVRLVAVGRHERGVHPFWDQRVLSGKKDGIYRAVRDCSHVVHFNVSGVALEKVSLVADKAVQIVVPRWHSLQTGDYAVLHRYALVVCPGKTFYDDLVKVYRDRLNVPTLSWAKWDSGLPSVRRLGVVNEGRIKACFLCGASTVDFCGFATLQLINALLDNLATLDITILATKSWSRKERQKIGQMRQHWGARLAYASAGDLLEQTRTYHKHDWLVLPGVRDDFGIQAQRAMSCGLPVIAYAIEPWNEIIMDRYSGMLMPCDVAANSVRAPLAVINLGSGYRTCLEAFSSVPLLLKLQKNDWHLTHTQQAFNSYWADVFGFDTEVP